MNQFPTEDKDAMARVVLRILHGGPQTTEAIAERFFSPDPWEGIRKYPAIFASFARSGDAAKGARLKYTVGALEHARAWRRGDEWLPPNDKSGGVR